MKKTLSEKANGTLFEQLADFLACCEAMGYPVAAMRMAFAKAPGRDVLRVKKDASGDWIIEAHDLRLARRGVAFALAGVECDDAMPFDSFGIMLDCSRNKVFRIDYLKRYFLQYALFGCTHVMLYCEDTYVLPDEPFWGYMRGGYTLEELRELDDWCSRIGIELSGCIQTLGHLENTLQWTIAYNDIRETERILLPGDERTYALIRKMLMFWRKALKSNIIHVGMDETHELGRGTSYYRRPGVKPVTLYNEHLARVNAICREVGYDSPMIWSDMFFRMASPKGDYYDSDGPLPEEIVGRIPSNVRLAYWDYYHENVPFYKKYIDIHRGMDPGAVLFSGIWTWAKVWYDHDMTRRTATPGIRACLSGKLRHIYFTLWGDDGAYCCYSSALAGFCYCAEVACKSDDEARAAALYRAVTGNDYRLALTLGNLEKRIIEDPAKKVVPCLGALLWDDPLLAIAWRGLKAVRGFDPENFLKGIMKMAKAIPEKGDGTNEELFQTKILCVLLCTKLAIREKLEAAYRAKKTRTLKKLLADIDSCMELMQTYMLIFRKTWLACAKPFGLEIQQNRQGGQLMRLNELKFRLSDYLDGKIDSIPELEKSAGPAEKPYVPRLYRLISSGAVYK